MKDIMVEERDWRAVPLSALGLSRRTHLCMRAARVNTVGDLCDRSAEELLSGQSFGETALREVREKLAAHGLKLRDHGPRR